jgi:hypothetical protein
MSRRGRIRNRRATRRMNRRGRARGGTGRTDDRYGRWTSTPSSIAWNGRDGSGR